MSPGVRWLDPLDDAAHLQWLAREGELLTRWPPAPFEHTPTDCFRLGDEFWIWQPGVGGIHFPASRPEISAYPSAEVDRPAFQQIVLRSWLPAIYQVWGRQVLHAGAVASLATGHVLAFAGPSGAGKSTLAYGLAQRFGWIQVADDTLAFSPAATGIALHPLLNDARLRPATAAHFGRSGQPLEAVTWPDRPLVLASVYFVRGDADLGGPARIDRLAPSQAYLRLLEQAHAFTLQIPEYNQRLMRDYLKVTADVPAFELVYRRSFLTFDATLDDIERHARETLPARHL